MNLGQTGFYRVLYDQKLYSVIEKEFDTLGTFDRWGIVSDLFAFLLAGRVTTEQYVMLAKRCANETDYLVADAVTTQVQFLRFISPENPLDKGSLSEPSRDANQAPRFGFKEWRKGHRQDCCRG